MNGIETPFRQFYVYLLRCSAKCVPTELLPHCVAAREYRGFCRGCRPGAQVYQVGRQSGGRGDATSFSLCTLSSTHCLPQLLQLTEMPDTSGEPSPAAQQPKMGP